MPDRGTNGGAGPREKPDAAGQGLGVPPRGAPDGYTWGGSSQTPLPQTPLPPIDYPQGGYPQDGLAPGQWGSYQPGGYPPPVQPGHQPGGSPSGYPQGAMYQYPAQKPPGGEPKKRWLIGAAALGTVVVVGSLVALVTQNGPLRPVATPTPAVTAQPTRSTLPIPMPESTLFPFPSGSLNPGPGDPPSFDAKDMPTQVGAWKRTQASDYGVTYTHGEGSIVVSPLGEMGSMLMDGIVSSLSGPVVADGRGRCDAQFGCFLRTQKHGALLLSGATPMVELGDVVAVTEAIAARNP